MKYVINDLVVLCPTTNKMHPISSPEEAVDIGQTTTTLLRYLLDNNNLALSREVLLDTVWKKRGYVPSDASLNNNISSIRRTYRALANSDLAIKTLPKYGFQLKCEVYTIEENNVDVDDNSQQKRVKHKNARANDIGKIVKTTSLTKDLKEKPSFPVSKEVFLYKRLINLGKINFKTIFFFLFIILSLFYFYNSFQEMLVIDIEKNKKIGEYKNCNFYIFSQTEKDMDVDEKEKIEDHVKYIDCEHKSYDVFLESKKKKTQFSIVCARGLNDTYNKCENFKKYIYSN